jgi:DNA-binding transcriptional MerR regulator
MTVYYSGMDGVWRIDELCRRAALALESGVYGGQDSARVRQMPDVRTIRYYTTVGLLDRPAEIRGRTAYYGLKHLLQLVAIKRLQSQGRTLVAIQQNLLAADEAILQQLAGLSEKTLRKVLNDSEPGSLGSESRARERFWERMPELPAVEKRPLAMSAASEQPPRAAVLLPVCEGASLLLEGAAAQHWQILGPEIEGALALIRQAIGKATGDSLDNKT